MFKIFLNSNVEMSLLIFSLKKKSIKIVNREIWDRGSFSHFPPKIGLIELLNLWIHPWQKIKSLSGKLILN
jgi:hypothetical protein